MYTFLGWLEMALPLGAVGKDEEMGRAGLKGGKKHVSLV